MREFLNEIRRYLTPVNTVIVLLCIIVFSVESVLYYLTGEDSIGRFGELGWKQVLENRDYYRVLTYMFLHGSLPHLFSNMIVLMFVGSTVEKIIGSGKYLINYICSGFAAGLASVYYNVWLYNKTIASAKSYTVSVGASGAIFGTVGALFLIVLINKGRVEGISTRRMIMFIVLSLYEGFTASGIDNAAHVAGLLFGIVSALILYDRRRLSG